MIRVANEQYALPHYDHCPMCGGPLEQEPDPLSGMLIPESGDLSMSNKVKFKLTNGFLPEKKTTGAGAYDLYSAVDMKLEPGETGIIKLGLMTEFDQELVAVIRDRSSFAVKGYFTSAGVIDSDYRGEWGVVMNNRSKDNSLIVTRGDRVAQVLFLSCPVTEFEVVEQLSETVRAEGGFGSTGK